MICVIDASLVLSCLFEDEQTVRGMAVLTQVSGVGALVPVHWRLEVANGLQTAVRRRRCDLAFRNSALLRLGHLPIEIDPETDSHAWTDTLHLSERFNLTVYDAAYLELALRSGLPIASRDRKLANAAQAAGVVVIPTD